jgi:uncharacterized protein (DUF697 family)
LARFSTTALKLVLGAVRSVKVVEARPLVLCGRGDPLEELRRALLAAEGSEGSLVDRFAASRRLQAGDEEQLGRAAVVVYGGEVAETLDDPTRAELEVLGRVDPPRVVLLEALDLPSPAVSEAGLIDGISPLDIIPYKHGRFPQRTVLLTIANKAEDAAPALASRLPAFRPYVLEDLIENTARRTAAIALAVWVPGANFPAMAAVQLRMVLKIAACYGEEVSPDRGIEILAALGAGVGLRTVARELLDFVPVIGWAGQAAVSYAGTKALGRAAVEYFERGAPADVSNVRSLVEELQNRAQAAAEASRQPDAEGPAAASR